MSGRGIWLRIGASTTLAVVLVVCVSPARPERHVRPPLAALAGAAAGALVFVTAARELPRLAAVRPRRSVLLCLWAANEEIVWRRVALGELLSMGVLVALALSSCGFALAHRHRRALQLGTGAVFGGVYVGTGWLGASIVAHWLYNTLVGARAERLRALPP